MKKVLLVNTNTEKAPYPVAPLGLCLLASAIESKYEVRVYDGMFEEPGNLENTITEFNPDYIGFSIRNIDDVVMDRPKFYIDEILKKFINPAKEITNVPVILGGSGFSIFPKELMDLSGADWGVVGEGEQVFPALLDLLDKDRNRTGIPRILDSSSLDNIHQDFYNGSKDFPFSEIDRHIRFGPYIQKGAYAVQTKRGCSHSCIYCNYPLIEGRNFRPRDPGAIADEIEQAVHRMGSITFEFVDSTFNDPDGHAEAICREIIRRKLKVRLRTMGINPIHASEELFGLMMEAGFAQIDATPDSASAGMLKNLEKGFGAEDIRKMAKLIRKSGLPTMWFFLFGGPGETVKTIGETADFIEEYVDPGDLVYLNSGLRIYPGTPLYKVALSEGYIRKGQPILYPPVFYFSEKLGKKGTDDQIRAIAERNHHCVLASDSIPPPEMMKKAIEVRAEENLTEPMFRTLVRIRREWMVSGKMPTG